MRSALLATLLLVASAARAQVLPFTVGDPNLQEDLDWLANQNRQNKLAIASVELSTIPPATVYTFSASSSSKISPDTGFTNAAVGPCLVSPGTVTVSLAAGDAFVYLQSDVASGANAQEVATFLVDGVIPLELTGGIAMHTRVAANTFENFSFLKKVSVSSGSHTFCLSAQDNVGSSRLGDSSGIGTTKGEFGVFQIGVSTTLPPVAITNGSMSGDGSAGSPLGVKSSSVAVLGSTGYVLNQQLDPSSVTKQGFVTRANLTGVNPANTVDLSTVQVQMNNVALATATLSASTVALVAQDVAIGLATTTIRDQFTLSTQTLSASTAAIRAIEATIGIDTAAIRSQFTLSTQTLSASTASLFNVKASTGSNGDITRMVSLRNVDGALVVGSIVMSGSTSTIVTKSSISANAYDVNGALGISSSCISTQFLGTQVVAGGIIVGGSCASPAGGGDMSTTGSNAVTGSISMNSGSTFTVANVQSSAGTTVSIGKRPIVRGLFAVVGTSEPFNSTTLTFDNLESSATYRITINSYQKTTQGQYLYRFNGDTGSNYKWTNVGYAGASPNPRGSTSDTSCELSMQTTNAPSASEQFVGEIMMHNSYSGGAKETTLHRSAGYDSGDALFYGGIGGHCRYSGTANVTSVTVYVTAGFFTGYYTIEQLGRVQ